MLSEIGKGSYGVVYQAKDLTNNACVAIKEMKLKEPKEGISPSILRELGILKRLDHPNVLAIKDFFIENEKYYLVFEYMDQDLKHYLDSLTQPLSEAAVKHYAYQLLQGLSYCHSNCIIHRDLKPHNLLMLRDSLKIADFGLSRMCVFPDEPTTPIVQTLWYRAPELLLGTNYNEKIDMWSLGCIFGELITGAPIFPGYNQIDQLWKIYSILGSPDTSLWPGVQNLKGFHVSPLWTPVNFKEIFPVLSEEGVDFLSKVLVLDPAKRISSHQALQHPYFREFRYVSLPKF